MKRRTIIYIESLQFSETSRAMLENHFDVIPVANPHELDKIIHRGHICFAPLDYFFGEKILKKASKLEVVATHTTGIDHIDVNYATKRNIEVISLRDEIDLLQRISATAEFTWGLILSLVRHIPFAFDSVRSGNWNRTDFLGRSLTNLSLGIVGLGRIGTMVADRGAAFGMRVAFVDPAPKSYNQQYDRFMKLEDIVQHSDIVTIHVHSTMENKQMFSEDIFKKFRRGSYFINTARGALVDETALLNALQRQILAGAAIDVLEGETNLDSIKSSPLIEYARNHHNVIITPHIGGATRESWVMTEDRIITKLIEYDRSHPI